MEMFVIDSTQGVEGREVKAVNWGDEMKGRK